MSAPRLTGLLAVAALAVSLPACRSAEDRARAEFSARLKLDTKLSKEERVRFFDEIGRAVGGKAIRIRQGGISSSMTREQEAAVLGTLVDSDAVYDAGPRVDGAGGVRGFESGATPAYSEIDATQVIWIDVDSFLPTRYEFSYSMPGLGDYAYDLTVDP